MKIHLKKFQDRFVFSPSKFPAFVGGWGVGKTMCGIARAMTYSQLIPDNLGIVFRKEYTDLRDSTCKDFEQYTGMKITSRREVTLNNNSLIMFRHIEELNNIQNVNLGWFLIEQGDELEGDKEFFTLFGRLRRKLNPTKEFEDLGLPLHSGFVIANAGDHWMRPLWKDGELDEAELIEATTNDNAENLPKDFLDTLENLKKNKPEIYKRFVLNDWTVGVDRFVLITREMLNALHTTVRTVGIRRIIACDPSQGGDECVTYVIENGRIIDRLILHYDDTMKIVGELSLLSKKHDCKDFAIDTIGMGAGVADRLQELGNRVQHIQSAEKAEDRLSYYNKRTEMWWNARQMIMDREVYQIEDDELKRQLLAPRYKIVNSQGLVQLEPKEKTKERLGSSPDRADAFVYGLWGLRNIKPTKPDRYRESIPYEIEITPELV